MSLIESTPNQALQDAAEYYKTGPTLYTGNFVLAKEDARALPVNLNEAFIPALATLSEDPAKARLFAERFGKLSINIALDGSPTSFTLLPEGSYAAGKTAALKTVDRYLPTEIFQAEEQDSRYAFLLFDETPMTVELGLIQALHMLDYALVSDQFDGAMPLFKAVDYDQLMELQSKYPEVLARTYGNIRGLADAPSILGTVIPTTLLEQSGLELPGFDTATASDTLRTVSLPPEREAATIVGITTAKRPHIGHGFLLTKAIAEAGTEGQVVVELNDLGPRVATAVSALAAERGTSVQETMEAIIQAEVAPSAVEAAYRQRGDFDEADLPANFALTANNAMYEHLLSQFSSDISAMTPIANSSQAMRKLLSLLSGNPAAQPLFGDTGMVLLGDEEATVIAQYGKPTMVGIVGAFATGYELSLVDSPTPLDKNQSRIFEAASIPVQQIEGMGLSINFGVASGTGGEAPSLQAFLSLLGPERVGLAPTVLRAVLNDAVFVRGDGKSLNPNFASSDVLQQKLQEASTSDLAAVDIYALFEFKNISRETAKALTPYGETYGLPAKGKINQAEIQGLLATLPAVRDYLSPELLAFKSDSFGIPKDRITQKDANFVNKLRSGDPRTVYGLLQKSLANDPSFVDALAETPLAAVMARMGYALEDAPAFLDLLVTSGEIYVLN